MRKKGKALQKTIYGKNADKVYVDARILDRKAGRTARVIMRGDELRNHVSKGGVIDIKNTHFTGKKQGNKLVRSDGPDRGVYKQQDFRYKKGLIFKWH